MFPETLTSQVTQEVVSLSRPFQMRHHPTHLDPDSCDLYPTAMLCFPVSIKKACGTSAAAEPGGTAGSVLAQPASRRAPPENTLARDVRHLNALPPAPL